MHRTLRVMISSTANDLPEHRKQIVEACLRQNMFPLRMEDLPANSEHAVSASLKILQNADVYIGIFAHRYGYIPEKNNPEQISITEMEYNGAVERKIERLVFIMDNSHPIKIGDIEIANSDKLKTFKDRIQKNNIVRFFKSPDDLRAEVINSLSKIYQSDLQTVSFHYISEVPAPPEAFIAHPYTLSQTHELTGRQFELDLLTDWATKAESEIYKASILSIVAIGGMGKSALTWKWFNDIIQYKIKELKGRMWWSFYESDATFENFIIRALAYVSKSPIEEVKKISLRDRESQLLTTLDREPFLIVLDGLERILIAYSRMDAARFSDEDYEQQIENNATNAQNLSESSSQLFRSRHTLRKTSDPRAGNFLRKLCNVKATKILISTRLYPADLQTITGLPIKNCAAVSLDGLTDDDAIELWRAIGVNGSRDILLPLFNRVENHPLVIQALASEVAQYRRSPFDFAKWLLDHPDFNPFVLPLVQVKSHVLEFSLKGLESKALQILQFISAFRMPATYDTLEAMFIGDTKVCSSGDDLDKILTKLEDRGLVGWDKRANRYDLHPVVRGVVWNNLEVNTRNDVYNALRTHFEAFPKIIEDKVKTLEDLTPAIELFNTLVGLEKFDDAWALFQSRLSRATHNKLSATRSRIELLTMLFFDTNEYIPKLRNERDQGWLIHSLAESYLNNGQPGLCARLCNNLLNSFKQEDRLRIYHAALNDFSDSSAMSGKLYESEKAARNAILISRELKDVFWEAVSLGYYGRILSIKNDKTNAEDSLRLSYTLFGKLGKTRSQGMSIALLTDLFIWCQDYFKALRLANDAWESAKILSHERDFIRSARQQGEVALGLKDFSKAEERLHHALFRARAVNFVEEELPALIALAELRRHQGKLKLAREYLEDLWELAERGPYPLFLTDAYNVLSKIEQDDGNNKKAVEAASKAFSLAWCDGPPYSYYWGLKISKEHLLSLEAAEPEMPSFNPKKFQLMPDIVINTKNESHLEDRDM